MLAVHAIVFSKDRAWQLAQLLRSLHLHVQCRGLAVSVLYTTSPPKKGESPDLIRCTDASYLEVAAEFSHATFVREDVSQGVVGRRR
jgi:hypothetical protein